MRKAALLLICLVVLLHGACRPLKTTAQPNVQFPIRLNGKFGYIDQAGKIVINPQFDFASDFSEELAAVRIGGRWGYIDQAGKIVINPQFDDARDFSEELTPVAIGGRVGYIDKAGKYVWNPTN